MSRHWLQDHISEYTNHLGKLIDLSKTNPILYIDSIKQTHLYIENQTQILTTNYPLYLLNQHANENDVDNLNFSKRKRQKKNFEFEDQEKLIHSIIYNCEDLKLEANKTLEQAQIQNLHQNFHKAFLCSNVAAGILTKLNFSQSIESILQIIKELLNIKNESIRLFDHKTNKMTKKDNHNKTLHFSQWMTSWIKQTSATTQNHSFMQFFQYKSNSLFTSPKFQSVQPLTEIQHLLYLFQPHCLVNLHFAYGGVNKWISCIKGSIIVVLHENDNQFQNLGLEQQFQSDKSQLKYQIINENETFVIPGKFQYAIWSIYWSMCICGFFATKTSLNDLLNYGQDNMDLFFDKNCLQHNQILTSIKDQKYIFQNRFLNHCYINCLNQIDERNQFEDTASQFLKKYYNKSSDYIKVDHFVDEYGLLSSFDQNHASQCCCKEHADKCSHMATCMNLYLFISCPSLCNSANFCNNQNLRKRNFIKHIIQETIGKGMGLFADQDCVENDMVGIYFGEILKEDEIDKRDDTYFLKIEILNQSYIIDSQFYGNYTRFINHSCNPNCVLNNWYEDNKVYPVFQFIKPIKRGEEITFNYAYTNVNDVCLCKGKPFFHSMDGKQMIQKDQKI